MKIWLARASAMLLAGAAVAGAQEIERKNPRDVAKPNGYSHVVTVGSGKLVFIAGQVGLDAKGVMVGKDDFAAQAAQAFANLRAALTTAGARPAQLVKLNYYVVGLNAEKLRQLREARDRLIDKDHLPASTLAGVERLFREDALVEIEAEAAIP